MINGFSGYDTTETNEFAESERLELGGHICKVLKTEIEEITSKKDGKKYNILKLQFDIEAPDKQAGFYQRKFKEAAEKDALNAKWKGFYRLTIPTNDSPDFAKSNWKTFLTSVEKSNPGVKLDGEKGFDENLLVGKIFAGVFGLEEMTLPDGKLITFPRIRFARNVESLDKITIPKVKLLDGTYVDYEEYIKKDEKQENNNSNNSNNSNNDDLGVIDSDSDLPF